MMDGAISVLQPGKMNFECGGHIERVLDALNQQRKSAQFCDAVLKVKHTEIKGHRSVLAATIPKLFEKQSNKGEPVFVVELEGLNPFAVESLVEFAYTAKLTVQTDQAMCLYTAAKILDIKVVEVAVERFIRDKIVPLDWMSVRAFAERNDCPGLLCAVDKFIEENVEEIYHKKDFFQLPRLQIELASTNNGQKEFLEPGKLCKIAMNWAHKQLEVSCLLCSLLYGTTLEYPETNIVLTFVVFNLNEPFLYRITKRKTSCQPRYKLFCPHSIYNLSTNQKRFRGNICFSVQCVFVL